MMLRLLIVEDAPWNQQSAQLLNSVAQIELLTSADAAYKRISRWQNERAGRPPFEESFDGVLTDLFLPVETSNFGTNMDRRCLQNLPVLIPAGLVIALAAVNVGIPAVIVTDVSHHDDWLVNMLDLISSQHCDAVGRGLLEPMPVYVCEAATGSPGYWVASLNRVVEDDDRETLKDAVGINYSEMALPSVKNWVEACKRSRNWPEVFGEGVREPS